MLYNEVFYTLTDIMFSHHCELFEREGGFAKLDEFVKTDIERHNELASAIRQNINKWKDQRKLNIEGKDTSRFNKSLNREKFMTRNNQKSVFNPSFPHYFYLFMNRQLINYVQVKTFKK